MVSSWIVCHQVQSNVLNDHFSEMHYISDIEIEAHLSGTIKAKVKELQFDSEEGVAVSLSRV